MLSIHGVNPSSTHEASGSVSTESPIKRTLPNPSKDQISSLHAQCKEEITGFELFTKSAIAITVGIIPFIGSKVGEFIVKASTCMIKNMRNFLLQCGVLGVLLEIPLRLFLGIPATIGAICLLGGAIVFSKTQALVWGQKLIEHPQQERINTKLARYGAGEKPWQDFKDLLKTFFTLFESQETKKTFNIDLQLNRWQHFEAN